MIDVIILFAFMVWSVVRLFQGELTEYQFVVAFSLALIGLNVLNIYGKMDAPNK